MRTRIVTLPHEYRWGSHHAYLGKSEGVVDITGVLRLFSEEISTNLTVPHHTTLYAGRTVRFAEIIGP